MLVLRIPNYRSTAESGKHRGTDIDAHGFRGGRQGINGLFRRQADPVPAGRVPLDGHRLRDALWDPCRRLGLGKPAP